MNTLKTTMSKIAQIEQPERTDLAKHEVELALVDDLKVTLNSLENQIFIDEEIISKTIKISSDLSLLNEKAKERINTNDGIVQSSFKKIQLAEKFIAQAERIAKELGVDVKTITNYNGVITAKNNAQDNIKTLSKEQNKLKNLVK